jgi:hypothetical protein
VWPPSSQSSPPILRLIYPVLAAFILIFADLAMAIPERNNIFWRLIKMFWLDGMTYTRGYGTADPYGTSRDPTPFFLAPLGKRNLSLKSVKSHTHNKFWFILAFFKIFITFGYLSQTFYGVDDG